MRKLLGVVLLSIPQIGIKNKLSRIEKGGGSNAPPFCYLFSASSIRPSASRKISLFFLNNLCFSLSHSL